MADVGRQFPLHAIAPAAQIPKQLLLLLLGSTLYAWSDPGGLRMPNDLGALGALGALNFAVCFPTVISNS